MDEPSVPLDRQPPFPIHLSARGLTRTLVFSLITVEILLVIWDAVAYGSPWIRSGAIRRLFNLTRDDGLGNWFASVQTLFVGLIWGLVYLKAKRDRLPGTLGWAMLALFFAYLAIDDGSKIHERIGTAVQAAGWASSFPSYTWILIFGPFLGAVALFMLVFLWRELAVSWRRGWLLAGLSCYAFAVGLDFVEGLKESETWFESVGYLAAEDVRHFTKVLEEFLEMLGTTFLLGCALTHFAKVCPSLSVTFK